MLAGILELIAIIALVAAGVVFVLPRIFPAVEDNENFAGFKRLVGIPLHVAAIPLHMVFKPIDNIFGTNVSGKIDGALNTVQDKVGGGLNTAKDAVTGGIKKGFDAVKSVVPW